MKTKNTDTLVLELLRKVEDKKKQIGNAERPQWQTNCSFRYYPDRSESVNILVIRDIEDLIDMHAHLTLKKSQFELSTASLNLDKSAFPFRYIGFSYDQWVADIETRLARLLITVKREELSKLESRVNALVSPEQRREIELEKLVKEIS